MSSSAVEIANLLYRYAELIDSGDLPATAALFRHAEVKTSVSATLLSEADLLALWREHVKIHACGTPRTKHLVTNPIIEIDEQAGTATSRSYYTVYQAAEGFPLQLIASGRYHDRFERVDGRWRFSFRDYSMLDLFGDVREHLNIPIAQ